MNANTARILRQMCQLPTEPEGGKSGLVPLPEKLVQLHDRTLAVLKQLDPFKTFGSGELALLVVLSGADVEVKRAAEPAEAAEEDEEEDEEEEGPKTGKPAAGKPAGKPAGKKGGKKGGKPATHHKQAKPPAPPADSTEDPPKDPPKDPRDENETTSAE